MMDLIQHLYSHYARISDTVILANDEQLRYPYNAEEPLEGIIDRINKCADFAMASSEPVSETKLIHIACGLVAETGQYPENCWEWRMQENKSWTAFQAHLIKAQSDPQERQNTSCQGRYRSNNLVGIKEVFANLAQETVEERAAVTKSLAPT